jgi:beta-lactamase class A
MMRSVAVLLLLAVVQPGGPLRAQPAAQAPPAAPASVTHDKQHELTERFRHTLERLADGVDGIVSYHLVDLTSGQTFSRKGDERFPTASAIKIGILYELFKQADEGRVALDVRQPLGDTPKAGGAGILQQLGDPALSPRDHAILMILLSDNIATNVLIDLVGMDAVNRRMAALGATAFSLERHMMDAGAVERGAENLASPRDLTVVMDAIRRGEGLTEASRTSALEILRRYGPTSIRAGVPSGVSVASKPGSVAGVRTEVAFVDLKGRPYLIAVMASFLADDTDGGRVITDVSRTAYRYFDRLSRAGREGRLR